MSDANKAIQLLPRWAKGYYRKAKFYELVADYKTAITVYKEGIKNCLNDSVLKEYLLKCRKTQVNFNRRKNFFFNIFPFVCFIGAWWIVITDSNNVFPYFKDYGQRGLFVFCFSFAGLFIVKLYYYYINLRKLRLKLKIQK